MKLFEHQLQAVYKMRNGCILKGGVGSGKSLTSLAYFYYLHGGDITNISSKMLLKPCDLFIITTAVKRDKLEWDGELNIFLMSRKPELNVHGNKVVVDSWQNIKKYKGVTNAFFIFDEQHLLGPGVWSKAFQEIRKNNRWILLSATPADDWGDYAQVFIANGFYRNITEFEREHAIKNPFLPYKRIDRYVGTKKLEQFRDKILIDMDFARKTEQKHIDIFVNYDRGLYKELGKYRWNHFTNEPIKNAAELCYLWRRIVNSDDSRLIEVMDICERNKRVIIFYNFNYELDILKGLAYREGTIVAEWNGKKHQPVPLSERWVYLVQYTAGKEAWNCITTDTMLFFSQNYSYKTMIQAAGRIDRLNTPYRELYYYHLKSSAPIDKAIELSISKKRKFNETKYAEKFEKYF